MIIITFTLYVTSPFLFNLIRASSCFWLNPILLLSRNPILLLSRSDSWPISFRLSHLTFTFKRNAVMPWFQIVISLLAFCSMERMGVFWYTHSGVGDSGVVSFMTLEFAI